MANSLASKVLEVLDRHSEEMCQSAYTVDTPSKERHCLLGWMAVEAGVPLPLPEYRTHVIGMTGTLDFAEGLEREYGLSRRLLKLIQFANDDSPDIQSLKKTIEELLENFQED